MKKAAFCGKWDRGISACLRKGSNCCYFLNTQNKFLEDAVISVYSSCISVRGPGFA